MAPVQPLRSKVAIVGTSPGYIEAPYSDAGWEVWGLNGGWAVMPKADRWFEMHTPKPEAIAEWYGPEYVAWLGRYHGPVYMQDVVSWVPGSKAYPIASMAEQFGEVWACTPAYMLALAITEGFEEIRICGMDLTGQDEYAAQREWVQHLRGVALGRGIKVTFTETGSPMEKHTYRYGYEPDLVVPGAMTDASMREFKLAKKQSDAALVEMQQAEGARRAYESAMRLLVEGRLTPAYLEAGVKHAAAKRDQAICQKLEADGAMKAAARVTREIEHIARSA